MKTGMFLALVILLAVGAYILYQKTGKKHFQSIKQKAHSTIYILLGAPGAGKGTLAEKLIAKNKFGHISTGNLCRINIKNQSEVGKKIEPLCKTGKLVPDDLILEMMQESLKEKLPSTKAIILDGFPRTIIQAKALVEILQKSEFSGVKIKLIHLNIPDVSVLVDRITSRIVCSNPECQGTFSLKDLTSMECPRCKSELKKRPDDEVEAIKNRIKTYQTSEKELLNFFNSLNFSTITLNGLATPDDIYKDFTQKIN
jgi:adenylate kinase